MYGSEISLLNLLRILKFSDSNFSICVISNIDGSQFNNELTKLNIPFYPIFKSDLHLRSEFIRIFYLLKIFAVCLYERPNIIHLNQIGGLSYLYFLKSFLYRHFKLIVQNRHQDDFYVFKKKIKKLNLINHIISVSENENKKILSLTGVGKSTVIYNPFDLKLCKPVENNYNQFLCVSRINEIKNQLLILNALLLNSKEKNLKVHFYGDIDHQVSNIYYTEIQNFVRLNFLEEQVVFKGFDLKVNDKYRDYRVLILPSKEEAMGRVIIEAFINGIVPIVLDSDTGAKEILLKMNLDYLLFENTAESLYSKMLTINHIDQNSYTQIISQAQFWIKDNLNDSFYLEQLCKVYA